MAVSEDRKYTKDFVYHLLEGVKGKTLGEVDESNQFERTLKSSKITGIAGDVIEQSIFKYARDSKQECDIEIDGVLTELKTTGVRVSKGDLHLVKAKVGEEYNKHLGAKEGISITGVTLEPTIQTDFFTSHFWEKAEHLLIVFYEYKSYEVVPASEYANFPIIGYCYNQFSEDEQAKLKSDWEIVRDYLEPYYNNYPDAERRREALIGFTHKLRPNLLLIELVPGYKKTKTGSYQKPRYRLKQTFVDYLVRGHFNNRRDAVEIPLSESFTSFAELDRKCHTLSQKYAGKTLPQLREELAMNTEFTTKDFRAKCILKMFGVEKGRINNIADFQKAGIIAKTITIDNKGRRTEDMKLAHIHFDEWADRDVDFEDSEVYRFFCEHSFLFPVFQENDENNPEQTTFLGFKRFGFSDEFIEENVRKTWIDSRHLIHSNSLKWEYELDKNGNKRRNKSGSFKGSPNFPKSSEYIVFFRGGENDSSDARRTETVNGIKMLPQYFWLKGAFVTEKLKTLPYL